MFKQIPPDDLCPCCSGKTFQQCCSPAIFGLDFAKSAESLMRSRYSAYAIGHQEYLLNTWDRSCRPTELALDENIEWTRLTILKKQRGRPQDDKGSVEFVADYRIGGEEFSLRENSRFVKKNLRWFYLVGN